MEKKHKPAGHSYTVLKQLSKFIPGHLVKGLARTMGIDPGRSFDAWSHVLSWLYAQLSHAISLNDVCDALRLNEGMLQTIRGAKAPCRNTLSHANRTRSADLAEATYWAMAKHLTRLSPDFARTGARSGYLRRFRRVIHAADATTIQLVAHCLDWARHRRRKAAAKCHLRLNLQSLLPECAIIDTARFQDSTKARELCAGLQAGEIIVFDKAYIDFGHLNELTDRQIVWVCRAKDNLRYRIVESLSTTSNPHILRDERIELTDTHTRGRYPGRLRRLIAQVEVDGQPRTLVFLSNQFDWSGWTIAELYRRRWDIETFFKEIKQTLQLSDFLGHNANAVRWQIWMALLAHLLLRYQAFLHHWSHSFTRLFTIVRAVLWRYFDLHQLLESYGTAGPPSRLGATPQQAYLPNFA